LTEFAFITGLAYGLILAAPAGPVGVMCVQRTLTEGRLHGLLSGLGAAFGDALYGAVAAFGVSAVEDWIVDHQTALRWVGGVVLLLLAARTMFGRSRNRRQRNGDSTELAGIHTESLFQDFVSTFVLAIANPITLIAFAGLLATLGGTGTGQSFAHAGWLIAGVFCGSAVWWLALALGAGCFRGYLGDGYDRWVRRISATILLVFGVYALAGAMFPELMP
jgi:threonine/homoserine/homoserine lactone efflux protein